MINRRNFLQAGALAAAGTAIAGCTAGASSNPDAEPGTQIRHNPIGVSTYSFWQFDRPPNDPPIEQIIDHAAAMGFDGVELLLVQMASEERSYLNNLKKRAFDNGLDLMGFSTHQAFVYPDQQTRKENIDLTIHQIELVDGIMTFRNPTVVTYFKLIADLCRKYRLPAVFDAREYVEAGGLASYGPNIDAIYFQLATYVDKLLKGTPPGNLPIEQPTKFELVINLKTAKELNLTFPTSVLIRADDKLE